MAMYRLGINTTVTTTAAAAAELRAASGNITRVREIGLTLGAATASTYGIGRPGAVGVTPTSPITVLQQNPSDEAGTTTTAVAWGTGPTVPTNFLMRITLPATIGAGVIWTFTSDELIVGPGNAAAAVASLVVWNLATNSASLNINFKCEE
jgi:hypothetical protein